MASHQFLKEGEYKRLLALISRQSRFITSPIHGLDHWQKVERNGHYLSQDTGANVKFSDEAKRIADENDFILLESYRKVSMDCSFHDL